MKKVLVIRLSSLGDIVQTFAALNQFSDSDEIHFLTKEHFRELVELHPSVKKIHTLSRHASLSELLAKLRVLQSENFDFVLDLHNNWRSRIATLVLARPYARVRKYRLKELLLYFFHAKVFQVLGLKAISRVEEIQRVTRKISPHSPQKKELRLPPTVSAVAATNYVCICRESAWPQKEWAEKNYLQLARKLRLQGFETVWIGLNPAPCETSGADQGRVLGIDATGKLGLAELGRVLANAEFLVSNDSGLMHLAEAVGTPVVAVFGPTTRELGFAPRLSKSRIAEADLWCRPCSKTGRACFRPVKRHLCLEIVTPESVLEKTQSLYAERPT